MKTDLPWPYPNLSSDVNGRDSTVGGISSPKRAEPFDKTDLQLRSHLNLSKNSTHHRFLSFFLFKPFLGRVVSDLSVRFLGRARTGLGLEPGTSSSSSGRALGNHRRAGSTRIGEIRGNYCTQRDEIAAVFFGRDDRVSASFIF